MRVTVGIPFRNAEGTLSASIRSVFAQSYRDWELWLVDDGSTDHSLDIARAVKHPQVHVISDGDHRRLSYRLNQIAQLANGEYLARMDADDLMHPDRLQRQVTYLDAHPEVDVVDTATYVIDSANVLLGTRETRPPVLTPLNVLLHSPLIHPAVTGRRSWFLDNPYRESPEYGRAQDQELWCRTLTTSTLDRICEPLFFYRSESAGDPRKILTSYSVGLKIARTYGPALVGWPRTAALLLMLRAKALIYRALVLVHLHERLIRRRNAPIPSHERALAQRALEQALQACVPGLDSIQTEMPTHHMT